MGRDEIKGYFSNLFAVTVVVQWKKRNNKIIGDKAHPKWCRKAPLNTGEKQDWLGVDV